MEVQFCGATRTTTGSMFVLNVNGQKILLECGLYQGRRDESNDRNRNFSFDPASIDVAVLSHSHIDHCGNFPNLVRQGYRGNIFSTHAARDLASIMLADSARIQQHDAEYISRKRAKKNLPPVEALYSVEDAERAGRQFVSLNYERPMLIADGVTLSFHDAGHILGSAQVVLDIREDGKEYRYLFTGDVGRGGHAILRDPVPVENVNVLHIESTYGNRLHGDRDMSVVEIAKAIRETSHRGGKIIIPSFAVERTQQLLYVLHQLFEDGSIPDVPVFVDSPLAVNATEIFRLHPECFNKDVYDFLFEKSDPFGFEGLTLIRSINGSKDLNKSEGQAIIISASGMCEAGRILHHLKNGIDDPKNTILFVGYCAQNTLGWKIREGWDEVKIFGAPYPVKAHVEIMDSFSGHADHSELIDYFKAMTGPKKKVWLIHGEQSRSESFCEALKEFHDGDVSVGVLGETVEF